MKLLRTTVVFLVLTGLAIGTGATSITAIVPEASPNGKIVAGSDFTMDIYLQNDWAEMLGISFTCTIYSPDGSITNLSHRDVGGTSADSIYPGGSFGDRSIIMFNGWGEKWNFLYSFFGFEWDGILPDMINFTGVGTLGWQVDPEPTKYISFALHADETGTFCIDSIKPDNEIYEWLFDDPEVYFNGPYCWEIFEEGDYLTVSTDIVVTEYWPGSDNPEDVTISIGSSMNPLSWVASNNSTWLNLLPDSGITPGELILSYDVDGLTGEEYYDTVMISAPAALNSPHYIEVILTKGNIIWDSGQVIHVPADYSLIQEAIEAANDFDTVLVTSGDYEENINYLGKRIKIIGDAGAEYTALHPYNPDIPTIAFNNNEGVGTEFSGFTVYGGGNSYTVVVGDNCEPFIHHNIFRNNIMPGGHNIAVITCQGGHAIITRNVFYENGGISCVGINSGTADIINNTFDRNNRGIYTINNRGVAKNNIVANSNEYGIYGNFEIADYNDLWNNHPNFAGDAWAGVGDISANPQFYNPATYDYELMGNSPCIDAGDPAPIYSDLDGSRNDIGAIPYEMVDYYPMTRHVPYDCSTIQMAIDLSLWADTVIVHPGIYHEAINFKGKNIVVKSSDGPLETAITSDSNQTLVTFNHGENSYALLEGFALIGGWMAVYCGSSAPTIRHNIMAGQAVTDWAAVSLAGPGYPPSATAGPAGAIIINNTIVHSANGGISSFSTIAPVIKNNIIAFNQGYGIHCQGIDSSHAQPLLSYNDVYNNQIEYINILDIGDGAISDDPEFNADFSLMAGSPCVNTGDPDPAYNDPDGTRNDMGAIPSGSQPLLVNMVQWRSEDGGNDHWYAVITGERYWEDARVLAQTLTQDFMPGYLATAASAEENAFILNEVLAGPAQPGIMDQFWLGGYYADTEWCWITQEPFVFSNWALGEPNNEGIEIALAMYGPNNDPDDPLHAPGTWNNWLPNDSIHSLHKCWSVVEWGEFGEPQVTPTNEWINVYCGMPMIDGEAIAPGTIITAYDPDGVLCGVIPVKDDGSYGFMPIYRDDIFSDFDEGAEPGDLITFRINGRQVVTDPAILWTQNGDIFELCGFSTEVCRTIHLNQGWNLISWNVAYEDRVENLITEIVDCIDVILGFGMGGLTYDPDLDQFATLETVDYKHGYWFRMDCAADLEICGMPIGVYDGINIYSGLNLISYWPDKPLAVETALASVVGNVAFVLGFDNGGLTWIPGFDAFNTLTEMKPLMGYWVKSASNGYLGYPGFITNPAKTVSKTERSITGPVPTSKWMSVYGSNMTLDNQPVSAEAVIEVYSTNDVLCGKGVCRDGLLKFTPVYGLDDMVGKATGYPDVADLFMIYIDGVRTYPDVAWIGAGERIDISRRFTSEKDTDGLLPTEYALRQNFPNPFNASTSIEFDLPKAGQIELMIYNALGRKVRSLINSGYEAGRHSIIWDGNDQSGRPAASGIYFYVIKAGDFSESRKMMLLK
nr:T9SS type A sorting domain-containing protein [candidate division Zixibacteria bacterium]